MKTHCLQHEDLVIAWVRIILALGTNHLNFGYESSGYETSGKRDSLPDVSYPRTFFYIVGQQKSGPPEPVGGGCVPTRRRPPLLPSGLSVTSH